MPPPAAPGARWGEDIVHCMWACPLSTQCWQRGERLLTESSNNGTLCTGLLPANVFIAQPLPPHWQVPELLWQILRAVLCWQIWNDRNGHYLADKPASQHRIISKSWHRILGVEWNSGWFFTQKKVLYLIVPTNPHGALLTIILFVQLEINHITLVLIFPVVDCNQ